MATEFPRPELLQQVRVIDPVQGTDQVTDVLIAAGSIAALGSDLPITSDTIVTAAEGAILAPGLIDLYSHSGEPGFEERETLASLSAAAIAGGFTQVCLLPDTQPVIDQPALVAQLRQHLTPLRLTPWAALTQGLRGEQMTELAELASAGIVGFADGLPIANWSLVRRLLEYGQPLGLPIALWAYDRGLAGKGCAREGPLALQFGLGGDPVISETAALAALLECIAAIGTPIHLMRLSTARGVALIQQAKEHGVPITASTTWLHVIGNTAALAGYDPNWRLEPPLGNPEDQAALLQGLKTGVIDAIAIDHHPYTYEEKTVAFGEAPPGAIGLELALPLLWQTLVTTEQFTPLELWRCLSTGPAACLGQAVAPIAVGQPVGHVLFAPQQSWRVTVETLQSRSHNSSWYGKEILGQVLKTFL